MIIYIQNNSHSSAIFIKYEYPSFCVKLLYNAFLIQENINLKKIVYGKNDAKTLKISLGWESYKIKKTMLSCKLQELRLLIRKLKNKDIVAK